MGFYKGIQHPDAFPITDHSGSAHQDDSRGRRISKTALAPIFQKMGIGTYDEWFAKAKSMNMFIAGEPKGEIVTYQLMALICKFLLLPPSKFLEQCSGKCDAGGCECMPAAKCYGRAKYFGIKEDGKAVRGLIEACGGSKANLAKLTDAELVELWSINEHQDIHCCGQGVPEFFHAVHATSLNDCGNPEACPKGVVVMGAGQGYAGGRGGEDSWEKHGPLGGFNDKGNHEQWPWYFFAKGTLKTFGVPEPPP
jgi:hypothetical protein